MNVYRRILLPVDGSDVAQRAAVVGLKMARLFNAQATAISVVDLASLANRTQGFLPDMYAYMDQTAEAALEQVRVEGKAHGVEVRTLFVRGSPAQDIIEESSHHDLVVMGTRGRSGVQHAVLGSVAEKVVRFASCPVLVVK